MSNVCLKFALVTIILINLTCLVKSDCVLSITSDLGAPGPLFIRNGAFMEANTDQGNITFGRSETVLISCPGTGRKILLGNDTTSYNTLEAHCIHNKTFRVDRKIVNFKDIRCNSHPFFTSQLKKETCHGRNQIYNIGFEVRSSFHTVYEACFDKNLLQTYYVKHQITPKRIFRQYGGKRPKFTEGNLFGKVRMNELYKQSGQNKILDGILGQNMAEKYLTKKQYLSRGHLAANADFPTTALMHATFHYVNCAPQWFEGNRGDWQVLEESLRRRVQALGVDVTVYTGTHGVMTLPNKNGRMQEIYLNKDENNNPNVPVPMYMYKLVYDPANKKAAVFISINSSFYNETMTNSLVFCENICLEDFNPQYTWLRWRDNDGTFSFCCDYDDFIEEVTYLPKLDVRGRFY